MTVLRYTIKALLGALFLGFIYPLWWAHRFSFSAARQIAGDPEFLGHSMPYEKLSTDLATVGYVWMGFSMVWLFWHVTRTTKKEG
ncbi:hypothetical protein HZ994_09245 [Akkermansiaceae bacterium]|nr:hypothetical protein HZ994_09245 [Akkermansiaceae bacterium]